MSHDGDEMSGYLDAMRDPGRLVLLKERIADGIREIERRDRRRKTLWVRCSAIVALLIGILAGWHSFFSPTSIAREAVASHQKLLAGTMNPEILTRDATMLKRFFADARSRGLAVNLPPLEPLAGVLVGGRVCSLAKRTSAYLVLNVDHRAVSFQLLPDPGIRPARSGWTERHDRFTVAVVRARGLVGVAVADLPASTLLNLARTLSF